MLISVVAVPLIQDRIETVTQSLEVGFVCVAQRRFRKTLHSGSSHRLIFISIRARNRRRTNQAILSPKLKNILKAPKNFFSC